MPFLEAVSVDQILIKSRTCMILQSNGDPPWKSAKMNLMAEKIFASLHKFGTRKQARENPSSPEMPCGRRCNGA